ncbi:MAG: ABC transporter permease, partial [Pseudomonadota bacterium]|nr:ABC transporter permease [Pseudomonadota bacterium]
MNPLAAIGRVALFTGNAVAQAATPPWYGRLILRQRIDIGYYSLPVVGLTTLF